jgi:hypothetical protein
MPSPKRAAGALRTPGLETLDDLAGRIARLRDQAARTGRSAPLDIAFMPSGLDMFSRAAPPPEVVVDELHVLAGLGVTWATVMLPGETRADLLREVDRFSAGVLGRL